MNLLLESVVPSEYASARLDAALAVLLPEYGLRARRRLWDTHRVLVNGVPSKPGWLVRTGDVIRLEAVEGAVERNREAFFSGAVMPADPEAGPQGNGETSPNCRAWEAPPFSIAAVGKGFVAFDKPVGLHTAHIAGSAEVSLEGLLPRWWKRLWQERPGRDGEAEVPSAGTADFGLSRDALPLPLLVTRLDRETSGIVLGILPDTPFANVREPGAAGESESAGESKPAGMGGAGKADELAAVSRFRDWERQGRVRKEYFALVRGEVAASVSLRRQLDTADRAVTRVLDDESPDLTRHTLAEPLAVLYGADLRARGILSSEDAAGVFTLLRVNLLRGARHQIRAHLAQAGFPILGDPLYGMQAAMAQAPRMYLHHASLTLPGFSVRVMPGWGLGEWN